MIRGSFANYKMAYSHLWQTYGRSWLVRLSYVLQVLSRVCRLIVLPVAISLIITNLSTKNYDEARNAVLLFVVFSVLMGALIPLIKYVGMKGENPVYSRLTGKYFGSLVGADLDYFHDNLAGYLTTATRQYVDSTLQLVRTLRDRYIGTILSIVFPLGVIFWLDPWLGLITLALSVIQAAYLLWASRVIGPHRKYARELYKQNSGRMADIVSNILAVKATAQEGTHIERVESGAVTESEAFTRRYKVQAQLIAGRELVTVAVFTALLWLTVSRTSAGAINLMGAILVVTYTSTILTGIYMLTEDLDEHDDFIDKIIPGFDILNRKNIVQDPAKPRRMGKVRGDIEIRNVMFAYDKRHSHQRVFKDFSLSIPHGQKVGVVGLSGAGKSTLTRLLLRFNDVDSGQITVDGTDIRDATQADLRAHIGYVPQEPLLFHASIRENVLLARPDASDADVWAALKAAHAKNFVSDLPDGLDSIVGERGVKLSGGQKQRVAIARAVLQGAPIIILDEATSALDSESEQIIKSSFAEILKGKTAIVVAHRLSTLSEMDRIIVIEKGKLAEDGTHEELLVRGGMYARLWQRQLRGGADEVVMDGGWPE